MRHGLPGTARRAHHGHADRRRRPRRRRRRARARRRCSTGCGPSTRRSAPTRRTARSAASTAASSSSGTRTPTCGRCSRAARSCATRRAATSTLARRREDARSVGAREGLGGGPRRRRSSTAPALRNYADQRGRRHPTARWRAARGSTGDRHPAPARCAAAVAEGRRGDRPRGRHVRRLRARRARASTRTPGGRRAGVLSVTSPGPSLGTADAYATAAFAMGARRRRTGRRGSRAATRR